MTSANPIRLPLCEYDDALGRQSLSAVIDELTLTYCVVDRDSRPLCRHLPSLREAWRWAGAYRDERQCECAGTAGARCTVAPIASGPAGAKA